MVVAIPDAVLYVRAAVTNEQQTPFVLALRQLNAYAWPRSCVTLVP